MMRWGRSVSVTAIVTPAVAVAVAGAVCRHPHLPPHLGLIWSRGIWSHARSAAEEEEVEVEEEVEEVAICKRFPMTMTTTM
jgi:hypothetical protein